MKAFDLAFDLLEPAASKAEHRLNRAAHEWSLAESILIHDQGDVRSKVQWAEDFRPHKHQIDNLVAFCRRLPVALLADDVGLGKTISAGLILGELMTRNKVQRALVVAPKVLGPQWVDELGAKFGIAAVSAAGAELTAAVRNPATPVVVTTYQSAARALEAIEAHPFEMLVLDEAHKLRNLHGSPKPPKMAMALRDALRRRLFKYVLMLTATPVHNRLWDMYSLIDCLTVAKGHQNPLGSPEGFVWSYLADGKTKARELKPHRVEAFRGVVRRYLNRTRRQDVPLVFPRRELFTLDGPQSGDEATVYEAYREAREGLNGLVRSSLERALFSSPAAFAAQVENTRGADALLCQAGQLAERVSKRPAETVKMDMLRKLIKRLRTEDPVHWRLVIFTIRRETQNAIVSVLEEAGIRCGTIRGGATVQNQRWIHEFRTRDSPDVDREHRSPVPGVHVLVSTDAGAEGVNLQVANTLVNYDLPWNPMVLEQRIGRVQRMGSRFESVNIFNLVVRGGVEEKVVARLLAKLQSVSEAVGEIESILENIAGAGDEGERIETEIARLVDRAFRGHDDEAAKRAIERSFEEAKRTLAANQQLIDDSLHSPANPVATGNDKMDLQEPHLPRLTRSEPSIAAEPFMLAALEADGWILEAKSSKAFLARRPGHGNRTVVFDPQEWKRLADSGVYQGRATDLCLPGRPAFERAVQRRLAAGSLDVCSVAPDDLACTQRLMDRWLARYPGAERTNCVQVPKRSRFVGTITCRASVSNGVDSYEKILGFAFGEQAESQLDAKLVEDHARPLERCRARELDEGIADAVAAVCGEDADLRAFDDFYTARLEVEVTRAEGDTVRLKRLKDDFEPHPRGQVVAASGTRFHEQRVRLGFCVGGEGDYEVELNATPALGWVEHVEEGACAITEHSYPLACLERCAESGQLGLRHRMVRSAASDDWMLPQRTVRCEVSGSFFRPGETLRLPTDGRRVDARLTQLCAVTGQPGLDAEMVTCELTGARILSSASARSDLSDRLFRADEAVTCAGTGKRVHRNETVELANGARSIPDRARRSDLSGSWFPEDEVRASDRSGRIGGRDEGGRCTASGRWLLEDELGTSDFSGDRVDVGLLKRSAASERVGVAAELEACELSEDLVLRDELHACAATGRRISVARIRVSDLDQREYGEDLCVICEASDRCCGPDQWFTCPATGKKIANDLAATCPVSGVVLWREAMETCPVTRKRLAPSALEICAYTRARVAPEALLKSDLTGKCCRRDESEVCASSGAVLHRSEMVEGLDGRPLARHLAVQSAVSSVWIHRPDAEASERTGRFGTPAEVGICAVSGRRLLTDELGACAVSGDRVDLTMLLRSEMSSRRAAPEHVRTCEVSGRSVLVDEIEREESNGASVACDLLSTCGVSGKRYLTRDGAACGETQRWCGPGQHLTCAVSGVTIGLDRTAACAVSGTRAAASAMVACTVTGGWVLPQHAVACSVSGRLLREDRAERCVSSGELMHPGSTVRCAFTGVPVQPRHLDEDAKLRAIGELMRSSAEAPRPEHAALGALVATVRRDISRPKVHRSVPALAESLSLVVGTHASLARKLLAGTPRGFAAVVRKSPNGDPEIVGTVAAFRQVDGRLELLAPG